MKGFHGIRAMATILMVTLVFTLVGCGPTTFTRMRIDYEPYSNDDGKKSESGITIERYDLKEVPPEFYATVQACDPTDGRLYVDRNHKPVMKKEIALPKLGMIDKIAITNNTGHVVRLNSTIITAFDPADNQYDTLSKEEIASYLMQERPCHSTNILASQLNLVKLINRNTELLPNRTTIGYLIYKPQDVSMPGIWKLSFYELPVETNAAGIPTKTVNFDFRSVCKKYEDTYRRENAFDAPIKISTREIN
ncbi:MAG: hypothetical protein K0B15_17265 [Lentimicrobium sp.]|nr:hypothetical protein [Lentimicrobium sp.]